MNKYLILISVILISISCNTQKKITADEEEVKLDVFGNPIVTYPDVFIDLYSLSIDVIQPDCDSLNGSIKIDYPDLNEFFYIEWSDFDK